MKYADIPFGGANKNECGFPNAYSPSALRNEFWYSPHQVRAYAEKTSGRVLIDDLLLMHKRIKGQESERLLAYNYRGEMVRERNGAIEANFYHTVKAAFGPQAIVGPHPTRFPISGITRIQKERLGLVDRSTRLGPG